MHRGTLKPGIGTPHILVFKSGKTTFSIAFMCYKSPICQTPKHCFIHLLQPVTIPGVNCNFNMLLISMLMYYFLLHMLFFINLKCFS